MYPTASSATRNRQVCTCLVGGADKDAVGKALGFTERKIVNHVQPVGGHPKAG